MKKKFFALSKQIDEQNEQLTQYEETTKAKEDKKLKMQRKTKELKSDIAAHDDTIKAKEEAINELKKLNQELEKFKFVLDYQIKELKNEMEPREEKITRMKAKVSQLDVKLETYHRDNGNLKREVEDLQAQLNRKQSQIKNERQEYRKLLSQLTFMKNDLYQVVQHIQDPVALREDVARLYRTHVTEQIQSVEVPPDVSKEYKRQKQHLEKTVHALKKKLARDVRSRKNDNMRIMQENVALIKEINTMRRDLKLMHQVQRQKELNTASEGERHIQTINPNWDEKRAQKLIDTSRVQIAEMRREIEMWQTRVVNQRPVSRERQYGVDYGRG
jgi:chromosome segregation ATPase